jgi:cytochrome c553
MNAQNITLAGLFTVLAMIALPSQAVEGDAAAGKEKNAMCQGCHGIAGFRTAYPEVYSVPKIGGQNAVYLMNALKAYRAGDRSNTTMMAIAAGLSDQDIADLAAYYSQGGK